MSGPGQAVFDGTLFYQSQQLGAQSGVVTLDLTKGNEIELTATGAIQFANPSGNLPAQPNKSGSFVLALTQGGPVGAIYGYTFTGSNWVVPADLAFTQTAGGTDIVLCQLLSNGKVQVIGVFNQSTAETILTNDVYNTNTATSATTLTAANISGGNVEVTLNMTGTLAGAANATLPTVASLVAAIPGASVGQSYKLRIINSGAGAFAWTVVTNTGWTLAGTMTVANLAYRDFYVTLTSLTAATLQAIGGGTA